MTEIFDKMLSAQRAKQYSNCKKRQIACIVSVGKDEIWGYNNVLRECTTCSRETCGAIHAEQALVTQLVYLQEAYNVDNLYIWAEPPCLQCLNFIKRYSGISKVYCLSPESYLTEYPSIERRSAEIMERKSYARTLGIAIIELDREEILEYELSKYTQNQL